MTGPHLVLSLAWIGAAAGPLFVILVIRRLLRGRRIFLAAGLGAGAVLFWILGVWAFLVEPRSLTVRHVAVESAQWRGPPLRIGVISDTHVAAPHVDVARVEALVARMNAERPDIVLLVGDYTGGGSPSRPPPADHQARILAGVEAFAGLRSPLGTYAVLGNHDVWFDDLQIAQALARANARLLENTAVEIARPGGAFWVGGVADMASRRLTASAPQTAAAAPEDAPLILMTHWPDPFAEAPDRVALTIAGHTHCGQVNLPVLGRPVLPSPGSHRWPCGLYDEGGRKLFVTGGVGVSVLPVRFRAPPEIVILTLGAPAR